MKQIINIAVLVAFTVALMALPVKASQPAAPAKAVGFNPVVVKFAKDEVEAKKEDKPKKSKKDDKDDKGKDDKGDDKGKDKDKKD